MNIIEYQDKMKKIDGLRFYITANEQMFDKAVKGSNAWCELVWATYRLQKELIRMQDLIIEGCIAPKEGDEDDR